MSGFLGVIGLVMLAAITPGPNNLIVLRTAARSGIAGAIPAIAGVVTGGLAMLALALTAAGAAFAAAPRARSALAIAGASYLAWLGFDLLRHAGRPQASATPERGLPAASLPGLFAFQFLNPKCWVLVMTAIGASPPGAAAWWPLIAIFVAIPAGCLLLWAGAGAALARWLARPRVALWVDRSMAAVLIASAGSLLIAALDR